MPAWLRRATPARREPRRPFSPSSTPTICGRRPRSSSSSTALQRKADRRSGWPIAGLPASTSATAWCRSVPSRCSRATPWPPCARATGSATARRCSYVAPPSRRQADTTPPLRAQGAQGAEDLLICFRVAEHFAFAVVPRYLVGYRAQAGQHVARCPCSSSVRPSWCWTNTARSSPSTPPSSPIISRPPVSGTPTAPPPPADAADARMPADRGAAASSAVRRPGTSPASPSASPAAACSAASAGRRRLPLYTETIW